MKLTAQIVQRRSTGRTTCATMPIPAQQSDINATLDRVVEAHGLRGIGEGWLEISAADALAIAAAVLHEDLAKQEEVMPFAIAVDLATQFFDLAPEPHAYFTNGDWTIGEDDSIPAVLNNWDPLSDAAVDTGVVCIGDGVAAVLWVEDED